MDKPIPEFEGYTINEAGEVKRNGEKISLSVNGRGYFKAEFRINKRRTARMVHRLVADAFIPNPEGLPVVNHKDGNKLNNDAGNLEWCTFAYNSRHSLLISGNRETKPIAKVSKGGCVKEVFLSIGQAAKSGNYSYRSLFEAVKNNKRYKGYRWRYCRLNVELEPALGR